MRSVTRTVSACLLGFAGGKGLARIRVQLSAGHSFDHIDKAIAAFTKVGQKYDILNKSKEEIIAKYGE